MAEEARQQGLAWDVHTYSNLIRCAGHRGDRELLEHTLASMERAAVPHDAVTYRCARISPAVVRGGRVFVRRVG